MPNQSPQLARQNVEIGNAITRLYREHYGRGATITRTLRQRNYVNVFLEDIYTPVERTLIDAGHEEGVRQTRHLFQLAMAPRFTSIVEAITERKVIAFMSQVHFAPDMAAEIFVLDPTASERAAT